jgi:hypothetical protein
LVSFLPKLIIALVLFPLGGILWGRAMWRLLDRKNKTQPMA